MKLREFLVKNALIFPKPILSLAEEGLILMVKGNPLHDQGHIFRLLDNLDQLLEKERILVEDKIDWPALILAICWHDVWRAEKRPYHLLTWFVQGLWEGVGSMRLFQKQARRLGLPQRIVSTTSYAIRKHSGLQFLPRQTTEAKILADIDALDEWSLEKLKSLKKYYLDPKRINPAVLHFAKFYFDRIMMRMKEDRFNYCWSRNEFKVRRKAYLMEVNKLVQDYGYLL